MFAILNISLIHVWRGAIYVHVLISLLLLACGWTIRKENRVMCVVQPEGSAAMFPSEFLLKRLFFIILAVLMTAFAVQKGSTIGATYLSLFVSICALFGAHETMRKKKIITNLGVFTLDNNRFLYHLGVVILWFIYGLFVTIPLI